MNLQFALVFLKRLETEAEEKLLTADGELAVELHGVLKEVRADQALLTRRRRSSRVLTRARAF